MRFLALVPLALLVTSAAPAQQPAATQRPAAHGATMSGKARMKTESQADLQKEAKMTMADARALAQRTVPNATVKAGEIEREKGKLIYSFDMKTAGKSGIDEVNIDAMTGAVISTEHETPKQEKAEAKADAKAERKAAKAASKAKAKY